MLCVPVLDPQGNTIAVLQAINKVGRGLGDTEARERPWDKTRSMIFTSYDVQILKALASHIGVSLQRLFETDNEDDEVRMRDTIRMLKEYGIAGLIEGNANTGLKLERRKRRPPLFPED